tara:strand:+ start:1285 stop:3897 length:2613 start_codon:yes stop_codon:yes gene_type:complete
MADDKNENIDKENQETSKKAFGPDKASLKAQQEYFDRAVDLNDQLKFQVSNLNQKTAIDKEQVKLSNQLVQTAKKLKSEYLNQKDLGKEISKIEASKAAQQKVQNNLAAQFLPIEHQRMKLAMGIEKGIQNQKKELAQIVAEDAKGLAIDEKRKGVLEAQISNHQKGLATRMKNFSTEEKQFMVGKKNLKLTEEIEGALKKEEKNLKEVNNALGLTGQGLKTINKLFGGALGNTDEILENSTKQIKALQDEGKLRDGIGGKLQGLGVISKNVGKSLMKNLNDPLTYIKIALDYSDQINKFQKQLGLSYTQAASLRGEMTEIAAASGNMAINSKRVTETFMSLNAQFGTASTTLATMFPEVVTEATKLQHLMGLSAKSTAEFAKMAIVSGKSLKDIKEDTIGAVKAAEQETGARLNIKEVMEATGQVSGQIKAQLAANPEAIAKAVAVAKQFGMELKDIEATSKSLLNFESSIEAELKAELLTGKQLNLEKARLAALTGDYETLAREINEQVGTFADFSQMNVLQQDALAASLGMTSDGLSEQLLKKANLVELAQEARAEGNEELALQLEARSASEKFQDVVMKIQTIFSDLVGGPLAGFIDLLGSALGILNPVFMVVGYIAGAVAKIASFDFKNMSGLQMVVGGIATVLLGMKATAMVINGYRAFALANEQKILLIKRYQEISGKRMGLYDKASVLFGFRRAATEGLVNKNKMRGNVISLGGLLRQAGQFVLSMFTAGAKAPFPANLVLPFVLGGIAGGIAGGLIGKFSKGDDVVSGGYGKRVLSTPEGSIALNDKDTVVAGTNLQQGDDVISAPAGSISTSSPAIDYNQMAAAMSNVQVNSQMSYDPYAARSAQGGVFYGNQAKKNKLN